MKSSVRVDGQNDIPPCRVNGAEGETTHWSGFLASGYGGYLRPSHKRTGVVEGRLEDGQSGIRGVARVQSIENATN